MVHVMPEQAGVPFWTAHTTPQAPQLATSFFVAFSHPLLTSASQFPKPALQVIAHVPFRHLAAPFVESHAFVQPPQFAVSFDVSVSQPFEALPSQSAYGVMHDAT